MSHRFRVTTEELEHLATKIDGLAQGFDDVATRRSVAYSGFADAGQVEDGLREFFGHWTDGMAMLHRQLTHLAGHLHGASSAYEATEHDIRSAASRGGS